MKINKDLIIFTHDYPYGSSERTFIEYELSQLNKEFDNIYILNQKKNFQKIINDSYINTYFDDQFSKELNISRLLKTFFFNILFKFDFWLELKNITFTKNFFIKLKMFTLELCYAEILHKFILNKYNRKNKYIFYSFWSNFVLLTFKKLRKDFLNSKFISRGLGSDINGFIKDDDYIPNYQSKFNHNDKLILLGEYQKEILEKKKILIKNISICPLGVYRQSKLNLNINIKNKQDPIEFLSCGNLIEIKNNLLMIEFLKKFNLITNRKVNYTIIGSGKLKNKIINSLEKNKENIKYKYIEKVENLIKYLQSNKVDFFMNFSSQEGMAFTVMESMSCGIPVIASNIKPNKYLINDRGYLFDINNFSNSVNDLIKEINIDLKNFQNYLNKSENSYNFINENLINEDCFKKFKQVILNI